jgi:hypothetical protein
MAGRPIYSTPFVALASVTGGPVDAYTVPPGHLAVVKDMRITWGNIIASGLDAWFQDDLGVKLLRYAWAFSPSTPTNYGGTIQLWGMVCLEPGQTIAVQAVSGTADFTASGYLLQQP